MKYIDIDSIILMFKTTYVNSRLTGEEIARILEIRFGSEIKKPSVNARNSETD
jgi:hypothetical protein